MTAPTLRVAPSLQGRLAARAEGRLLVIDAFRSWQCGTWIGDLTVEWWRTPPRGGFVALTPIEGVPAFVHGRLVRLLDAAGAILIPAWPRFLGGLAIELARPELWIDYLDRPLAWAPSPAPDPGLAASPRP